MICGIDEAGRGPVIGPLVICGIEVENDDILKQMGVRDSKKLTRKQRGLLSDQITRVANKIEFVEIEAEEIDAIREELTLNELEAKIFASVIDKLGTETAYIDSVDVNEDRFGKVVASEMENEAEIISKHRADELFPVVSAASILAKIKRDGRLKMIEDEIGEPIGSGYPSDPYTIRFLESWVERYDRFPPHTRKSWDTCNRIIGMKQLRRLDEF